MVKTLPSNAGGVGSIFDQETVSHMPPKIGVQPKLNEIKWGASAVAEGIAWFI